MSQRESQVLFLKIAAQGVDKGANVAELFAETIEVGIDSMYRRMRGESTLSLDEACAISKLTNTPLDSANPTPSEHVLFNCGPHVQNAMDYAGIFVRMNHLMDQVLKGTNPMMYYVALDVPLFYAFPFRAFAKMKSLYWGRVILNLPEMQHLRYGDLPESNEQVELAQNVFKAYYMTPSVEIWTKTGMYNSLKQVEYAWDTGMFTSKQEAMNVLADMEDITDLFKRQVVAGRKINPITGESTGAPFHAYYNDLVVSNNSVYIETDQMKWSVLGFNTFNMMATQSEHYNTMAKPWVEQHIARSVRMESAKQREVEELVMKYMRDIDKTRQYIEFKENMAD